MPSAKSDKNEIKLLMKKRNLYYNQPQNLFSKIFIESSAAIKDGSIDKAKVEKLFQFIDSDNNLMNIFPNNILYELLSHILLKNELNIISKEIFIDFLSNLYTNNVSPIIGMSINLEKTERLDFENSPDLIKPPELDHSIIITFFNKFSFKHNLKYYLYDKLDFEIDFKDRFFGFTGNFENYTRKTCFEKVRELGGVPSEPANYLDYLFVSNKFANENIISSTLSICIYFRRLYGQPKIFTEDDWELITAGNNK